MGVLSKLLETMGSTMMDEDAALLKAIEMLGFDPKTMGPLAYDILSTELKRRFREQGYIRTFEQIRKSMSNKYNGS